MPQDQPRNSNEIFKQAFGLHQQGAIDAAKSLYSQLLKQEPRHFDALHLLGVAHLQQGDPKAAVEFIGQALAIDQRQPAAFSNRGAGQVALLNYSAALSDFDRAIALKPLQPEAHYNRAKALVGLGRAPEAMGSINTALSQNPNYAEALVLCGLLNAQSGAHDAALTCYEKALAIYPASFEAHFNRANALCELGRHADALASFDQALTIVPNHPDVLNNRGDAQRHLKKFTAAISDFQKAILAQPDFAGAHVNLAMSQLATGEFAKGWRTYEWRLKTPELAPILESATAPQWRGDQDIAGKTILLKAEQGLGDTIQFSRLASLVAARGARVVLEVPRPLRRLLANLDGVSSVIAEDEARPVHDYFCPLMSLPFVLGLTVETIPSAVYLKPDSSLAENWKRRLASTHGLRVGLVWAGSPRPNMPAAAAIDKKRSLPLSAFEPLGKIPGVTFVSLQKGSPAAQLAQLNATRWGGPALLDYTSSLSDFADTAALTSCLDLVITCDTAVAHLAGGLGIPVWVLSRFDGCWRWLTDRTDSPWYPSMKLFHQTTPGDWGGVVASVAQDLAAMAR